VLVLALLTAALTCAPVPADAESYRRLMKRGARYYRMELYRESVQNFLQARTKHPTLEAHFNSGAAFFQNGQYQRAIESFSTALSYTDKPEELADLHYNLGNSYFELAEYEQAAAHYMQGLDQDPGDLNMKFNLELALRKLEKKSRMEQSQASGNQGGGMGQESAPGENADAGAGGDSGEPGEPESAPGRQDAGGGTGEQESGPREPGTAGSEKLDPDEAQVLINAVNNDQDEVMREIIRRKTGADEQDKGW
jgi:tetratricopeptide (TPR) repeat protein